MVKKLEFKKLRSKNSGLKNNKGKKFRFKEIKILVKQIFGPKDVWHQKLRPKNF